MKELFEGWEVHNLDGDSLEPIVEECTHEMIARFTDGTACCELCGEPQ